MPCTNTGSSGECNSSKSEGNTLLTNSTDNAGSTDATMHRIIQRLLSLHAEDGHPPLDIHRIDRRVHPLNVGSSGERKLHSFLPQCHLSCSNLHVLTPRHVFLTPRHVFTPL